MAVSDAAAEAKRIAIDNWNTRVVILMNNVEFVRLQALRAANEEFTED